MAKNAFDKSARVGNEKVREAAKKSFFGERTTKRGGGKNFFEARKKHRNKM